jgi:hypothetical protein
VDGVNGRTVVVDVVHNSIEHVTTHLLINVENHVRDMISDTKSPTVIKIRRYNSNIIVLYIVRRDV